MGLTLANYGDAIKEMYPESVLTDMTFEDNPLLAMVPKNENAVGSPLRVSLLYGNQQSRSADLATAVAKSASTSVAGFDLTTVADYAVATIDRATRLRTESDEGAFASALEVSMDGAINVCSRSLAKSLYRTGNGELGQTGAPSSADPMVLTLVDINDITNFEINQTLEADSTTPVATAKTLPATGIITAIDRDAGTITIGAYDNSGDATNWAANDYLFQDGDTGAMISGLDAWFPTTSPSSQAFFSIDRTADTTRLGGVRVAGTSMPTEVAALKCASKVAREGGRPKWIFVNDVHYHEAVVNLGSKVEYIEQGVTADVYFSGVRIHGPKGPMDMYADYNCPSQRGYVLTPESIKLYSIGKAPHIFDEGTGQEMLRAATTDNYEARVGYYAQFGSGAPGWNGVFTLDAITFA